MGMILLLTICMPSEDNLTTKSSHEKPVLSHIDHEQKPTMVDVSNKLPTLRQAFAKTVIMFPEEMVEFLNQVEIIAPKGPVFATAIIAGTMAAKKTAELIPFCHPIMISSCKIEVHWISKQKCELWCIVKTNGQTGVEMEALTGCTVAALTVYDMCKALSHHIIISETRLMEKSGGKHQFVHQEVPVQ